MEQLAHPFQALVGNARAELVGTTRLLLEHSQPLFVEATDDGADRAFVAAQMSGDRTGVFSTC